MSPMVCEGKSGEEPRKFSQWAKKIKEEAVWALSLYFSVSLKKISLLSKPFNIPIG